MQWLFRRSPVDATSNAGGSSARDSWTSRRKPVRGCFGCGQARSPYVYGEDGHDYCLVCARKDWALIGLRPAGRRKDDLTLEDILAVEAGG